MSLKMAGKSNEAVEIKDTKALLSCNHDLLHNPTYWHKFFIEDVHGLERDQVLKIILEHVQPLDFIPLAYSKKENDLGASFFARLCGPVVRKIVIDSNLTVPNSYFSSKPFKMRFILRYTTTTEVKVDLYANISQVLAKRFKKDKFYIQLDNFEKDPDLIEFCTLSQPKMMAFILNLVKSLTPIVSLKLNNNGIKSLEPIKMLKGLSLKYIDLRNNEIKDLTELDVLKDYPIKEIWLEGNPVCAIYDDYNYTQRIMECCPSLQKLDGLVLRQNGFPSFRRNLLCNMKAYDLVNSFLERYFTNYDSKNITKLQAIYGKESLFSLTVQTKNNPRSDGCYKTYSRNLLSPSEPQEDYCNNNLKNLWFGCHNIMQLFDKLPQVEHDSYSFTVDLSYYSKTHAVILITGVFRQIPVISKRLYSFSRNFVLQLSPNNEYFILNDQLHISDANTSQQSVGFKHKVHQVLPPPETSKQENELVYAMGLITDLTHEWCKRFLEECQYDLKQALILVTHLVDKIPSSAFIHVNE